MTRKLRTAAALGAALTLVASGSAVAAAPVNGAKGIGDSYYPNYGNGGYNVSHYAIDIGYQPKTGVLTGTTTITARALESLKSFHLDFVLTASSVTVDGKPASFNQKDRHELVVTPASPVASGARMTVRVTYRGKPGDVTVGGKDPFFATKDGAVAIGEPEIAAWWFPSNDHPKDKATYDVSVSVPKGVEAISNGVLLATTHTATTDTWKWRENIPMASYLAYFTAGQFTITKGKTSKGLPWVNAVATGSGAAGAQAAKDLALTPKIIDWESSVFGPYPFDAVGGVMPNVDTGFALENQTRPVYSREFWSGGESDVSVVVHENAHQWFGDSVSVNRWRDIWLNEGFATYAEWLWAQKQKQTTTEKIFSSYYRYTDADDPFWDLAIANPGAGHEFDNPVYDRGAMALQALRNRVGDKVFFKILTTWTRDHRHSRGSVAQFIALSKKLSGKKLDPFFHAWLWAKSKPKATKDNGFRTGSSSARTAGVASGDDASTRQVITKLRASRQLLREH